MIPTAANFFMIISRIVQICICANPAHCRGGTLCTACKCSFPFVLSDWLGEITWATLCSHWSSRHYCEAAPACSLFHTHFWSGCLMSSSGHYCNQHHCHPIHHQSSSIPILILLGNTFTSDHPPLLSSFDAVPVS